MSASPSWVTVAAFAVASTTFLLRARSLEIGKTVRNQAQGGPVNTESTAPKAEYSSQNLGEDDHSQSEPNEIIAGSAKTHLSGPATRAAHEAAIPDELVAKIPDREKRVLCFFLDFFKWSEMPIDAVLINGGYVRDLLLNKHPDDLDISLCLSDCSEDVTVSSILLEMPNFIAEIGAEKVLEIYGFSTFKSVDIQGDVTKDKNLDTAKAVFGYAEAGEPPLDVDVMPTIGEESYDEDSNRIPTRDQRGTPLQDALRRDLTIGAMLVKVQKPESEIRGLVPLQWTLLDYYGGLEDLRNAVLRAPHPPTVDVDLLFSKEDRMLAKAVGLDVSSVQDVWWVKILRDDPLRIVRAFRFAAKLDFQIHESFWKALPFALDSLKSKVAGSRKMTEITKMAKYGNEKIIGLFKLCFRKRFIHDVEGNETCLATGIFGGQDSNSVPHYLPPIEQFAKERFLPVVEEAMPDSSEVSADEILGCFLAVAMFSTRFKDHEKWEADNAAAGVMSVPEEAFDRACNGLSTSNDLRSAGMRLLSSYEQLRVIRDTEKMQPTPIDLIFGSRLPSATLNGSEESDADAGLKFRRLRSVWEVLNLAKQPEHYAHELIVSMLSHGSEVSRAASPLVQTYLSDLRSAPPTNLSGKGVSSLKQVPPHLRGTLITSLHILCRMRGETGNLDAPGALENFMQTSCENLLTDLLEEWFEADSGELKLKYMAANAAKKSAKKAKTPKKKA